MATPFLRPPLQFAPLRHREVAPLSQVAITACPASRQPPSLMRPMSTIAIAVAAAAPGLVPASRQPPSLMRPMSTIAIAAAPGLVDDTGGNRGRGRSSEGDRETNDEIKTSLYRALEGTNRGIFGITSAKKSEIEGLVELLESHNPTPQPTDHLLATVDGCWKLVYSTILILGVKRTKLGLRDLISLGDFFQIIDVAKERAVNVIKFNVRGFAMLTGQLNIEASFKIASKTRVNIKLENSNITPDQLMNLFQKNYDLLLAIFNPEGWLEITYVDDSMRIGRDDKGNIFVLERTEEQET